MSLSRTVLDITQCSDYFLCVISGKIIRRHMEKKAVYIVSGALIGVIILGSYRIEPAVMNEPHIPETPYSAPGYSLKPITMTGTSTAFSIPWNK
jgi:hypothetical protein